MATTSCQEGTDADGTPARWRFTEIKPDSFHWLGERSADGGTTWRLEVEFFVRRAGSTHLKLSIKEKTMFDHVSIGVRDIASDQTLLRRGAEAARAHRA